MGIEWGGLFISINAGLIFNQVSGFGNDPKKTGVSANNFSVEYVLEALTSGLFGALYISNNSGTFFIEIDQTGKNYFGLGSAANDNYGQAPRDIAIAINPNDVNEVHIAGIITFYSTNGGIDLVQLQNIGPQEV